MHAAYLFQPSVQFDKARKVDVTGDYDALSDASAEDRLRCLDPECMEAVSPVRRNGKLNHFRHHPRGPQSPDCPYRSDSEAGIPSFQQELEQAREIIANLTAENARSRQELKEARQILANVELRLADVESHLKVEEQKGHQAEEIIHHIEGSWVGKPAGRREPELVM